MKRKSEKIKKIASSSFYDVLMNNNIPEEDRKKAINEFIHSILVQQHYKSENPFDFDNFSFFATPYMDKTVTFHKIYSDKSTYSPFFHKVHLHLYYKPTMLERMWTIDIVPAISHNVLSYRLYLNLIDLPSFYGYYNEYTLSEQPLYVAGCGQDISYCYKIVKKLNNSLEKTIQEAIDKIVTTIKDLIITNREDYNSYDIYRILLPFYHHIHFAHTGNCLSLVNSIIRKMRLTKKGVEIENTNLKTIIEESNKIFPSFYSFNGFDIIDDISVNIYIRWDKIEKLLKNGPIYNIINDEILTFSIERKKPMKEVLPFISTMHVDKIQFEVARSFIFKHYPTNISFPYMITVTFDIDYDYLLKTGKFKPLNIDYTLNIEAFVKGFKRIIDNVTASMKIYNNVIPSVYNLSPQSVYNETAKAYNEMFLYFVIMMKDLLLYSIKESDKDKYKKTINIDNQLYAVGYFNEVTHKLIDDPVCQRVAEEIVSYIVSNTYVEQDNAKQNNKNILNEPDGIFHL